MAAFAERRDDGSLNALAANVLAQALCHSNFVIMGEGDDRLRLRWVPFPFSGQRPSGDGFVVL